MKAEIKNNSLFIDGTPKCCPYQPTIVIPDQNALGQVVPKFAQKECGTWCALVRIIPNIVTGEIAKVDLRCGPVVYSCTDEAETGTFTLS